MTGRGPKVSKQSVDYRRASGRPERSCGRLGSACSMWQSGFLPADRLAGTGSCTHVRGIISKVMVCDDWEARDGR